MIKDFDRLYSGKGFYWGLEADWIVHIAQKSYFSNKKLNILDLGAGEGRNSFILSSYGHNVTAIDFSEVGIYKLNKYAEEKQLKIRSIIISIDDFFKKYDDTYDVILGLNIFQSLKSNKIEKTFNNIKEITNKGGYNVISSFVGKDSLERQKAIKNNNYLFRNDELKNYYTDWNIKNYFEYTSKHRPHDNNTSIRNITEIIAQKTYDENN